MQFLFFFFVVVFRLGEARPPFFCFYLLLIVFKMSDVINFLDIAFGLMAIPTILSTVLLAPRVNRAAREYFLSLSEKKDAD